MMAYLPAVLVFSACVNIVLADDAIQSVSINGLPQQSATRALSSHRFVKSDENALFQTEMLVQSSNSNVEAVDFIPDDNDRTEGGEICQDLSESSTSGIPPNLKNLHLAPIAQDIIRETRKMTAAELGHDVPNGQTPSDEQIQAASYVLGKCLDVLVILIILDGIKRWHYKKMSSPDKFCDADRWPTVMQAALAGDTTHCVALLKNDVDIAKTDMWGCTLLHGAAKSGKRQIVKQLLECGSIVDERDLWGEMPLHIAARAGHVDICELLIEHGTPINAQNAEKWTPLVIAANEGRQMTCKLLLNYGATVGGMADSELPQLLTGLLKEEEFPSLLWKLDEQDDYSNLIREDDDDLVQHHMTA